jgi:hypothetical protein
MKYGRLPHHRSPVDADVDVTVNANCEVSIYTGG